MNFVWFVAFAVVIFLTVLLGGVKYRTTALYALAIGGVVNANFFNAVSYPIEILGLSFGIDSIIYTLFIFCVIVMLIKEGRASAYLLAWSSIIAILFSALMQFVSDLLSVGSFALAIDTFLSFIFSIVASIITIVAVVEVLERLKGKLSSYVLMLVGICFATIINTGIYYPLTALATEGNIGELVITSVLGKMLAMGVAVLTLYIINVEDKRCGKKAVK